MKQHVMIAGGYAESLLVFRGDLIKELIRRGAKVSVAAPEISEKAEVRSGLLALGAEVYDLHFSRTGINPFRDLAGCLSAYRTFRKASPDILLMYTIKPVIYGAIAGWVARVPRRFALITGLGYAFTGDTGGLLRSVVTKLYRFALGRVHNVFFQNPDDQALFEKLEIIARSPSMVINGSGIHLGEFPCQDVPEGPPVFLMIARFLRNKGIREFASAAARVKSKCPSARFLLAGWIDDNPDAISESEIQGWVADGVIEFLGRLEDVRPAIASCTVYVLPSYREGTPRTVLEAMAMGRAIITTDAPGCRETVVAGENGYLVPVQSVDALEEAMLRFVYSPQLTRDMGRKSRAIAEDKYDVREVNGRLLAGMGVRDQGRGGV